MFSAATGNESEPSTSSSVEWSPLCRQFELQEILSATEGFDESLVIGQGGFGKVYKGNVYNGSTLVAAAIKRLDAMSNQGGSEFWAEVGMLSKLRHCHLVSLIGYCNYEREMILVYEYMPRGTLDDHLHKLCTPLSWCQRLKICIGAARGLDYLHAGTSIEFGIIHRDVKSSNILLHESWESKISDFGLSKVSPRNKASTHVSTLVKGSFGYFDPYYFNTGHLTSKTDVYAFGVVLLEVLCRKRAVDDSLDWGLAQWAQVSIKEGRLKNIVDSDICGEISPKCLKQFAQMAERCLNDHPNDRPTMAEVFLGLENVLTLQEKNDILLQTASKTILARVADVFSLPNSGMEFGSMPKSVKLKFVFQRNRARARPQPRSLEQLKVSVGSVKLFGAKELEMATRNFAQNMKLGQGGFGTMYKGILPDNRMAAIKKVIISHQVSLEEFVNEIVILRQINHANVVQLLGCCLETKVLLIAYEFVSNDTLYDHIHNNTTAIRRLSWDSRLRIAHESASALAYLHSMDIIHRDVKSVNILLDENYSAKVLDFCNSKRFPVGVDHVTTLIVGTFGYVDPEYVRSCKLTDKCDVYSFGVVLAELLTGLKPIDGERHEEDAILATYFVRAKMEKRWRELINGQVLEEASYEQLEAASNLVCRCLEREGQNRPSMKEVTMELERLRNIHPSVSQDNSDVMIENEEPDLYGFPSENIGERSSSRSTK